jgi:hypothetical protein
MSEVRIEEIAVEDFHRHIKECLDWVTRIMSLL